MSNILEVPLEADGEVLTIDLDNDLPEDPSEICVLLENEKSAAQYWLAFGSAYARKNQHINAVEVVTKGLEAPIIQSEADKMPFYSSLCWLYLRELRRLPTSQRKQVYEEAVRFGNKAFQVDRSSETTALARGLLALNAGDFDGSLQTFQTVLSQSGDANIFAKFGRARVLYHRKNYKGALALYQSILRQAPSTEFRPDPRVGIGLCFWRLGDRPHAFRAWRRALTIDPSSLAANALLGIYYLDEALHHPSTREKFESDYTLAIGYMQTAYKCDRSASLASVTIASYLFSRQNMPAVLKLAEHAMETSTLPALVSDAHFWKGRVQHFNKDFEGALKSYKRAVEIDKNNVAAAVGKGVVELALDSPETLLTLETVATNFPKNSSAVLYSGLAYAYRVSGDPKRVSKAIQLLEKYLALKKTASEQIPVEIYLLLAKLHEQTKVVPPTKALEYMEQAIASYVDDRDIDPENLSAAIYNNRGVLAYFCGKYDEARASFQVALRCQDHEEFAPTISYNLARLEDASGKPDEARAGYNDVLKSFPEYTDALVRTSYLDVVLGSEEDGESAMNALMSECDDNLAARALEGWYLRRNRRGPHAKNDDSEQRHYKHTLMDIDKHDTYSLVAMGNLYLMNARELRVSKDVDAERKDKAYYKASEFFDKALQIDPYNAYAAQGIAIILAETKRVYQALQILGRIRETINDVSVYVNSGHCYMDLKDYTKAIEMYEQAFARTNAPDSTLFALLGRSWYAQGITKRDIEALRTALDYSERALHAQPESPALKFNVAFIKFQAADLVRRLTDEQRTSKDIEKAQEGLKEAIISIREMSQQKNSPFPPKDLEQRSQLGEATILPQLERAMEQQKTYESKLESKLQEARKLQQEESERLETERKRKREQEEERERKLAEERRLLDEEASKWEEERAASSEPERKKRKNEKDDFIDRDSDNDEHMDEVEEDASDSKPPASPPPINDNSNGAQDIGTKGRHHTIEDEESEEEEEGMGDLF